MNIIKLCEEMDWQQVVCNGGPPCFHADEEDGRFCGRALRWEGHPEFHKFVSLADLIKSQIETLTASLAEVTRGRGVILSEEKWALVLIALSKQAFREAEIAVDLQLDNTAGPRFVSVKEQIETQIKESHK